MIAVDLGASNGRIVYGVYANGKIDERVLHRFVNRPVSAGGVLYWDILSLFAEIKEGFLKAREQGLSFETVGVCSWGNTIALYDANGDMIANPVHYRDGRAWSILNEMHSQISEEDMFKNTWYKPMNIQPAVFIRYMLANKPKVMAAVNNALMISDVITEYLTGEMTSELTQAATSQLVDLEKLDWNRDYMKKLGIREDMFPPIMKTGRIIGKLKEEFCSQGPAEVVAVSGHDTASAASCAYSAAPEESLYLSCGTWSCMGCVTDGVIKDTLLYRLGVTNDLGLCGQTQLRFNHTGLWILQECKRSWEISEGSISWETLNEETDKAEPFLAVIDTEAEDFFKRNDNMPKAVADYCKRTGQRVPKTRGEIARVITESLAFRYRFSADTLKKCSKTDFKVLSMLGGGSKNELLCSFTANALNMPVLAGPNEATVLGSFVQQCVAKGLIKDFEEGRKTARISETIKRFDPKDNEVWDKKYKAALSVTGWAGGREE